MAWLVVFLLIGAPGQHSTASTFRLSGSWMLNHLVSGSIWCISCFLVCWLRMMSCLLAENPFWIETCLCCVWWSGFRLQVLQMSLCCRDSCLTWWSSCRRRSFELLSSGLVLGPACPEHPMFRSSLRCLPCCRSNWGTSPWWRCHYLFPSSNRPKSSVHIHSFMSNYLPARFGSFSFPKSYRSQISTFCHDHCW